MDFGYEGPRARCKTDLHAFRRPPPDLQRKVYLESARTRVSRWRHIADARTLINVVTPPTPAICLGGVLGANYLVTQVQTAQLNDSS
jgi:hypothetical protein